MQRCDDCNSNVDGERVLCVGCADARAVPPAPMPDLAAAIKQAEEALALFDSPCTPLPHEVYQDRAMDALRLILAAAKATSAPAPFHPTLVREVTEEAKGWLSAPYSNHGPQAIVDARGIMFRLLAVIHEASPAPLPEGVAEAAERLIDRAMHTPFCRMNYPADRFCDCGLDGAKAALRSALDASPSSHALRRCEVKP